jgi:hypothetical protein
MSVRVYVPLAADGLAGLVGEGRIVGPFRAHAVTAALVEAWPEADDDELEYAAMAAAGDASWALRGDAGPGRRVVVAGDVPAVSPVPGDDPTLVDVAADLPLKRVASAHVDVADVTEADLEDTDLAWFATQEIPGLV